VIRLLVLAFVLLAATQASASVAPSAGAGARVRQPASLLFSTFYRKLDPHAVIDAERTALVVRLRVLHAKRSDLPRVPRTLSASDAPALAAAEADAAVARGTSRNDAVDTALKAMTTATRDRYTTYFTPREYRDFDEILDPQKLSGIGVLLDVDEQTKYIRAFFVVPETPADRAGIHSGDLLESVDGNSTRGWSVADARRHLLGKTGTSTSITFADPQSQSTQTVSLERADVKPPTVYFSMLPHDVAYIYVSTFGNDSAHEFHTAVKRSEAAGARGYILDLRNDGGGIVGTALQISSEFVSTGPLVSIESNGGEIDTFEADDSAIAPKPLAVLVNGYSASASEITAAAISESGTGVLVGTKTFGKGVVQSVTRFPDGSAIKITTGRYFTPLNHDINGHGIEPGVVVEENPKAIFGKPEQDAQLARALQLVEHQVPHKGV
jgi:carboxyl-terminal processing protease